MLLSQEFVESGPLQDRVNSQSLSYPERIIQIGEGNFLRAFADWVIHRLNQTNRFQGRVVVAAPRPHGGKNITNLNHQDGLYTVWLRGVQQGKTIDEPEIVTSVSRGIDPSQDWRAFLECAESPDIQIVISNTTEAGLAYKPEPFHSSNPQVMFPARLTAYLYHRYQRFSGSLEAGMMIIPCELVEDNGVRLKELVLQYAADWKLSQAFVHWLSDANCFCNTLVDRIVTGKPSLPPEDIEARLGYRDNLVTVAEPFYLWVIQGDDRLKQLLGVHGDNSLNVHIVDDVVPFQLKKVRILNGAHTAMSAVAHFAGIETVREVVEDSVVGHFIRTIIAEEIVPALTCQGITTKESEPFAEEVWERFSNPFIQHQISSLALNGLAKIKSRLLPTLLDYVEKFGDSPKLLAASFAASLLFYKNADQPGEKWIISDDPVLVAEIQRIWEEDNQTVEETVTKLLSLESVWGTTLAELPGLCQYVVSAVQGIRQLGMRAYLIKKGWA
ncbi:tagaturonate reductase [Alicyclobacillus sp. SO9]|uniref:tagaturonate reductase n=1 Tax=Alicyclobacillus sp. SO9 TaxID=2665646 RepID=UPI0018E7D377|nr:tagaturonate reductase [Alicyclobacillus sp. SO9]QQE77929.1 tagaturonate reductase [Alicyclobacillus sp. SO9]